MCFLYNTFITVSPVISIAWIWLKFGLSYSWWQTQTQGSDRLGRCCPTVKASDHMQIPLGVFPLPGFHHSVTQNIQAGWLACEFAEVSHQRFKALCWWYRGILMMFAVAWVGKKKKTSAKPETCFKTCSLISCYNPCHNCQTLLPAHVLQVQLNPSSHQ